MRAVICPEHGEPSVLRLEHIDEPVLTDSAVRITVKAAGVNFADILMIDGSYQYGGTLPFTAGMEFSGIVEECGDSVTGVKPGDRVCAASMTGAWAESAVVNARDVHIIPGNMSFEQAAAFPVVYGTSHLALEARGKVRPGETLLVLGAGGGVGLTAVEIGKRMGATVIGVAGSDERLAAASAQGADHVIDHRTEDIRDRAKELTDGRGVDVVYDPVGGSAFEGAFRATARNARIIVVGFASGDVPQIPANIALVKNLTIHGYVWGAYRESDPETMRRSMATLLSWYEEGSLNPHPPTVMPLGEAEVAVNALIERRVTGKIVLRVA